MTPRFPITYGVPSPLRFHALLSTLSCNIEIIALLIRLNRAIFNLSVILTAFPRVNGVLYSLQDDILFPQISRRELRQLNLGTEESESSASPPTGTDSNASSHNAKRESRLKAWKRQLIMRVWEHKSKTPDHGAVEGCNTSVDLY